MSAQVQGISTVRAAFTQPQRTGVRQKGLRSELLEKYLLQKISEQVTAEFNPEPPTTEFCSTMKADYTVEGFQSVTPPSSTERTYATEQAITFWSDNWQRVQGVTAVQTLDSPFKRNATFSTPIGLQMGEDTPYVPDHDDHL
ncbi:sperm-associated antigen 8 [Chanos chanos]|uniref:Sperm-associated antigen 8 n=1 Tax=Chanos chanos TaxID=29144 RepID=A0A6J2UYJ0_CHACN|nr:sperm-associated antigen 8-like [Chanos chanos]